MWRYTMPPTGQKTPRPLMSGTEESLWFAPGDDYVKEQDDIPMIDYESDDDSTLYPTSKTFIQDNWRSEQPTRYQSSAGPSVRMGGGVDYYPRRSQQRSFHPEAQFESSQTHDDFPASYMQLREHTTDDNDILLNLGLKVEELIAKEECMKEEIRLAKEEFDALSERETEARAALTNMEIELGQVAQSPPYIDHEKEPMLMEKTLEERILNQGEIVYKLAAERLTLTEKLNNLSDIRLEVFQELEETQERRSFLLLQQEEQTPPRRVLREILTDDKFVLLGKLPRILPAKVERLRKLRVELDQAQIRAQVTQRAYEESKHQFEIERQKHLAALNDLPGRADRGAKDSDLIVEKVVGLTAVDRSRLNIEKVFQNDHKAIIAELEVLSSEGNDLEATVDDWERQLAELKERIAKLKPVKQLLQLLANERRTFVSGFFQSIKHGGLRDVQYYCAALDLQDTHSRIEICVDDLVDPASGLSPLHTALMAGHDNIVRFLANHSGDVLVRKSVVTSECSNLTALYIAVVKGDISLVEYLLHEIETEEQRLEYLNQKLHNHTSGLEFGELPLAASVWSCMSREGTEATRLVHDIITYLTCQGADMELANSEGNTLLHLLVLQAVDSPGQLPYFRCIIRDTFPPATRDWYFKKYAKPTQTKGTHDIRPHIMKKYEIHGLKHLMEIENRAKLTPLSLAAQVESPLFEDLINMENVMRFSDPKLGRSFSSVETYNVTNVTSLDANGGYNIFSVMHVLTHNQLDLAQRSWKEDIVNIEPLCTLIHKKWELYKWFYYLWSLVHLIFMCVFSVCTLQIADGSNNTTRASPANSTNSTLEGPRDPDMLKSSHVLPVAPGNPYFAFFLILPAVYLVLEMVDIFRIGGLNLRFTMTGNGLYRGVTVLFCLFVILWFILQLLRNVNQDIILALALLFGWMFLIFFTRTIRFPSRNSQIGAFSIMVQRMLFNDLVPFMLISGFILVSFSTAFHATLLHSKALPDSEKSFRLTFFQMLNYYSSLEDTQGYEPSREQEFAKLLLTIYGIFSVILMVNMLIAAMNKSYEIIRDTRSDLVLRQRLAILLLLERRLPAFMQMRSEESFVKVRNHRTGAVEAFLKIVTASDVGKLIKKAGRQSRE